MEQEKSFFEKIEELMVQVAEWKTRFIAEREWRKATDQEKGILEEKYSQVVYELGSTKKTVEELEGKIKLLTAGVASSREPVFDWEGNQNDLFTDAEDPTEVFDKFAREELRDSASTDERESEEILPGRGYDERFIGSLGAQHHIYTNPIVYESPDFSLLFNNRENLSDSSPEDEPQMFYWHDSDRDEL